MFPAAHTNGAGQTSGDASDAQADEIAVICHELRNSLAVVSGATRLLQSAADGVGLKAARLLIERQVAQMSRHIEDLLQPQRRNGHRGGLHLTDIDLRAVALDALDDIRPEMARRRHRLTVKLPDAPVRIQADATRLEQAFSNLLINAVKFTPDGGDITLTMERDHDMVRTHVRDSGIGIEPQMLSRIFGMFVQVGATGPSSGGGSGIGLAVVANVVESHGGTVKATSLGLGSGSKFTIALPLQRV